MMTFDEARVAVLSLPVVGKTHTVPIESATGFTLAEPVLANFCLPRFDNSGVDGFAIHEADLDGTRSGLLLSGLIQAGDVGNVQLSPGTAVRVMTGAPVPAGTAAVVMQEDTELREGHILVRSQHSVGENIRRKGREIQKGQTLADVGTVISAPLLSALASNGTAEVTVYRKPDVALLLTGNELASLGEALAPGQLYESNSYALRSLLEPLSNSLTVERVKDSLFATQESLARLLETSDVVITSGGVSVGSFDFVRPAVTALGFELVVPKVSIKPGKPFCCATRSDGKVIFGLPGNPMSALTTFALFAWPWLRQCAGLDARPAVTAALDHAVDNRGDRDHLMAGVLALKDTRATVSPLSFLGSFAVGGMTGSNTLLRVPASSSLGVGAIVECFPVPWEAWS